MSQPGVQPTDQQKVGQVLTKLSHLAGVAVAASWTEGVHQGTRLRRAGVGTQRPQVLRARCMLHERRGTRAAHAVAGAASPQHLPRKLTRSQRRIAQRIHVGVVVVGELQQVALAQTHVLARLRHLVVNVALGIPHVVPKEAADQLFKRLFSKLLAECAMLLPKCP